MDEVGTAKGRRPGPATTSFAGLTIAAFIALLSFGADAISFFALIGTLGLVGLVAASIGVALTIDAFKKCDQKVAVTGLSKLELRYRRRAYGGATLTAVGAVVLALAITSAYAPTVLNFAPKPSKIPTIALTGDRRTLDPCGLVDLDSLRSFGHAAVSPGTDLDGCTAYFDSFDHYDSLVSIRVGDPGDHSLDGLTPRGNPEDLGGGLLQRYEPTGDAESECFDSIQLSDTSLIQVKGYRGGDPCLMADIAASAATKILASTGLHYDPDRLSRVKLAALDACSQNISSSTLAQLVPGLRADQRLPDLGDSQCTIGDYVQGSWYVIIAYQVWPTRQTAGSYAVAQVGSRSTSLYTSVGAGCTSYLLAVPHSAISPEVSEYVAITVNGPAESAGLCNRARAVTDAINAALPQTL
jgi:eukaryotic-like serine/threonine-protein kinase